MGAVVVVTLDRKTGELKVDEVGQHKTRGGALWGTALGAVAGLLTGGLALLPAVLVGASGGGVVGSALHKKVGMSDEDSAQMASNLRSGGAALVVMADDFEVATTEAEMVRTGGTVTSFMMPEETKVAIAEAVEAQEEAAAAVDEAVEAVPQETAEAEAAVTAEMPELAPEMAEAVAKIVAATNLSSDEAAKLHDAGIDKASQLLVRAATPQARRELAAATGLSNATILAAVKKTDLMRIHGVGVKHSDLLLAAGVDTVPELAQRNPKNLFASLSRVNADKQIVADLLKEAEVTDWVARANAAPRIIMY